MASAAATARFDGRGIERGADEDLRRVFGPERRFRDIGQADRAAGDLAALNGQHDGRGGGGVIADLALQLFISVAVTGGRHGNADRGQDVARLQRGEIGALVEIARRDAAFAAFAGDVIGRVQAHHHRRHVVAGIAIGDIAAQRAEIAHLRIGDEQRGFAQDRQLRRQQIGADQLVLGGHRADDDVVALAADAFEVGDAGEIDQMGRLARRSFIIGIRLWPPASARPSSPSLASSATASCTDAGR